MNRYDAIKAVEVFVKNNLKDYDSGHDWWHIERVRRLASSINDQEVHSADPFTLDIAALLHDTADSKFSGGDTESGYKRIELLMTETGLESIRDQVIRVIRNISFSKKNPSGDLNDPLFMILQDADRLDAIGAIGIARAFNYGGFRNNVIHDPGSAQESNSTISHFYDKLLVLRSRMNTLTAKRIAIERHEFMEMYLRQFYKEWELADVKNQS